MSAGARPWGIEPHHYEIIATAWQDLGRGNVTTDALVQTSLLWWETTSATARRKEIFPDWLRRIAGNIAAMDPDDEEDDS